MQLILHALNSGSSLPSVQVAKAAAMGPRHDDSLLAQAVGEPYLSTVRKDASSARKAGWFWSYRLSDLYVRSACNPHTSLSALVTSKQAHIAAADSSYTPQVPGAVDLRPFLQPFLRLACLYLATEIDVWPQRFGA